MLRLRASEAAGVCTRGKERGGKMEVHGDDSRAPRWRLWEVVRAGLQSARNLACTGADSVKATEEWGWDEGAGRRQCRAVPRLRELDADDAPAHEHPRPHAQMRARGRRVRTAGATSCRGTEGGKRVERGRGDGGMGYRAKKKKKKRQGTYLLPVDNGAVRQTARYDRTWHLDLRAKESAPKKKGGGNRGREFRRKLSRPAMLENTYLIRRAASTDPRTALPLPASPSTPRVATTHRCAVHTPHARQHPRTHEKTRQHTPARTRTRTRARRRSPARRVFHRRRLLTHDADESTARRGGPSAKARRTTRRGRARAPNKRRVSRASPRRPTTIPIERRCDAVDVGEEAVGGGRGGSGVAGGGANTERGTDGGGGGRGEARGEERGARRGGMAEAKWMGGRLGYKTRPDGRRQSAPPPARARRARSHPRAPASARRAFAPARPPAGPAHAQTATGSVRPRRSRPGPHRPTNGTDPCAMCGGPTSTLARAVSSILEYTTTRRSMKPTAQHEKRPSKNKEEAYLCMLLQIIRPRELFGAAITGGLPARVSKRVITSLDVSEQEVAPKIAGCKRRAPPYWPLHIPRLRCSTESRVGCRNQEKQRPTREAQFVILSAHCIYGIPADSDRALDVSEGPMRRLNTEDLAWRRGTRADELGRWWEEERSGGASENNRDKQRVHLRVFASNNAIKFSGAYKM
ncbi:hypothetical protein C8F04DRAFT_1238044 [Mycena alexandri]|uniref:Uncharacterized protein n=1 Tax=Mycena alexandri TaxID=1745969 RepID=A0AAD6WW55_9AGAR|nr:hypothetical protein C8F04DRAFT_1238044 [Mycena alexandri]